MLDASLRPLINPPLDRAGRALARRGVSANQVTIVGVAVGLAAAGAMAVEAFAAGIGLILLNRLCDGLDGGVARARGLTEFGAFLDILADFVFYAAIPVGFALADPVNRLPAVWLLASFLVSGVSFLAYAVLAARRGLSTDARGRKGFYHAAGIAEGTETIAVFVLCGLQPAWFPWLATGYAAVCVVTGAARLGMAWQTFDRAATPPETHRS